MLKKLRAQLTILYLLSSVVLALLVGGGAYTLVRYYFQSTNDQALRVKVGLTLAEMGIPLSPDLQSALAQAGFDSSAISSLAIPSQSQPEASDNLGESEKNNEHAFEQVSSLADIFVLPLAVDGQLLTGFGSSTSSIPVNLDAVTSAEATGADFRTFTSQDGHPVRLFTTVVNQDNRVLIFQAGRFLTEQQGVLKQLMETMVIAGGLVTLFFGLASWLLAGRTIKTSQEAWDKQQTFVANASHELRAPLTLIHAGVELGLRKVKDTEQRELLADVLVDADYMKKLIEDLLLLSRLDARSLKIEIVPVEMTQFIEDLTRQMSRLAENQEIKIENSLLPITVLADPVRLKQVLIVVLDNALRNSTAGGSIQIETKLEKSMGLIQITDHGQGIDKKDIKKVFDRFYKVDDRSSHEYRGSGLGLSIARGLIEAQKGHISLASKPGFWTTVRISLPSAK